MDRVREGLDGTDEELLTFINPRNEVCQSFNEVFMRTMIPRFKNQGPLISNKSYVKNRAIQ